MRGRTKTLRSLTSSWSSGSRNQPMAPLCDTAYTVVGSRLFVFGEYDGGWDGISAHNTLLQAEPTHLSVGEGETPLVPHRRSRAACRMVSYGNHQLVVFAGWTCSASTDELSTDELHVFYLDKGEYSLYMYQTTSQAKSYGSRGAVRKFRCYVCI